MLLEPTPELLAELELRYRETGRAPLIWSRRISLWVTWLPDHARTPERPIMAQGQPVAVLRESDLRDLAAMTTPELQAYVLARMPKTRSQGSELIHSIIEIFEGTWLPSDEDLRPPRPPKPR